MIINLIRISAFPTTHAVIQQSTAAKHHPQSVNVKMALTEDLKQKQRTFGECTLYLSYCAWLKPGTGQGLPQRYKRLIVISLVLERESTQLKAGPGYVKNMIYCIRKLRRIRFDCVATETKDLLSLLWPI